MGDIYAILISAWGFLTILISIITWILIWKRRNMFPIAQRLLFSYYLEYFAAITFSLSDSLSLLNLLPCNIYFPINFMPLVLLAAETVVRAIYTLLNYKMNMIYGKFITQNSELSKQEQWFIKRRKILTSWKLYVVFISFVFLLFMIGCFISMGVEDIFTNTQNSIDPSCTPVGSVVLVAVVLLFSIVSGKREIEPFFSF